MPAKAATVEQYLASLPDDRRAAIQAVRAVILKNLDKNYAEGIQYGMIGYFIPHSVFPPGYHCDPKQPLPFAALASQKQHMSLYLMGLYCGCGLPDLSGPDGLTDHARWFRDAWTKTGKKLDIGKSCVRFKKLEDVALDVVGEAIRRMPAKAYIEVYQRSLPDRAATPAKKSPAKTSTTKPTAAKPAAKKKTTKKQTSKKPTTKKSTPAKR